MLLLAAIPLRAIGGELPSGPTPAALKMSHFPGPMYTFVWRNWEWVPVERMAAVLGCKPGDVLAIGRSMGLVDPPPVSEDQWQRSYITIIRRNWHLLPYEQMLALLDWDEPKLAYMLKEDDFLYVKLGNLKPKCEPLKYAPPTNAQKARAKAIADVVSEAFGKDIAATGEPRFAFVKELSTVDPTAHPVAQSGNDEKLKLRYLYSYFALYGDPLSDPALDPYPEGYLQKLAALGVNGVWMQAVLNTLAPSKDFPEFGKGWEKRLENLRTLVQRAKRYGIGVYLYFNEPRTQDKAFFEKHPDVRGVPAGDQIAMCVSTDKVKRLLTESTEHIFKHVPDLGGAFTITASENLTNCWSHHHGEGCPRCSKRPPAEVVADTNRAMAEGIWRANPNAKFIVWDWGWRDDWVDPILSLLPKKTWFMSVSEWSLPITRGGIKSVVGEYSLSSVGPGPRATRHWAIAKKYGLKTVAKTQINNTWEMAATPYVPVLELVGEHGRNLAKLELDGIMLSWTLGGYPSPNLELISQFYGPKTPSIDEAMQRVAVRRFGQKAAPSAVSAWKACSAAMREYPYHCGLIYSGPHHWGPANLLYPEPTGYRATMVGIPYDDLNGWRACYPPEIMAGQFEKLAAGFQQGLAELTKARGACDTAQLALLDSECRVTEAIALHTKSVANQVRFVMARDALAKKDAANKPDKLKAAIAKIIQEEIGLAKRHYHLCRQDSRIGYEATNHYWYVPLDLAEKVVNCRYLLDEWLPKR
ncbi:MAG: hypothetical protein JXQ73_29440 [Phycisphaerae bacterium]|nr:hypothetical protein [Phycisphaerae bacterium]